MHEHLSPVLALGASGAGVDLQHDAELVLLAAKHVAQFEAFDLFYGGCVEGIEFRFLHVAVLYEFEGYRQFVDCVGHFGVALDPCLQILYLLHLGLGFLGVFPEVGYVGAQFLLFYFYLLGVYVEISAERLCALGGFLKLFLCNHECKNSENRPKRQTYIRSISSA